jgi:hypothetical protein
MQKKTRLETLKNSLEKKEKKLSEKISEHLKSVKQANGQPLNDKRNGNSTLKRWEKQEYSIRNLNKEIEITKKAIEVEENKVIGLKKSKEYIPNIIIELVEQGKLNQWRKHPNTFFVNGVQKARLYWDTKTQCIYHKYAQEIEDKEQRLIFSEVFNFLANALNKKSN